MSKFSAWKKNSNHPPSIFMGHIFLLMDIFWLKFYQYKPRITSLTLAEYLQIYTAEIKISVQLPFYRRQLNL